ncbi:Hypothetical predicted protein [Paramuricea clavata]|uniref:Uncharacterized protein n=1 Tax=Paramuricea clavata TaxID=317549 RepID=A0A7D9HGP3_PARCT|nr:Hypothetical predicted protein [Paramuricea clavata]
MEGSSRISTTGVTGRSSGISSARTSVTEIDPPMFDDDVFPVRTTTPNEEMVPECPWYMRLLSEWFDAWVNVHDLWRTRDCWSKLYAILSLVCLPVRVIRRAGSPHNNITIPDHTSVCYLFLLMCYTFVLNLIRLEYSNNTRDTFVAGCMALAILAMLYLYLFTKDRVRHDSCHDAPVRIFFRGGLYVFGFASIMNSICLAHDELQCKDKNHEKEHESAAAAQILKALFVAAETLFLGYFHKACFPVDTAFLQISLAHVLGTNLALWFWTLCEEAKKPQDILKCTNQSTTNLNWHRYKKYFYPIFVEYLILALSILYGLWINLRNVEERFCRFCKNCARCLYRSQNSVHEEENNDENASRRERYIPRCGLGIMIGMIYVAVFLFLMLLAILDASGQKESDAHNNTHKIKNITNYDTLPAFEAYCYGSVVMYLSMISACYIILASLRSPNDPQRIRSIDYDDVLLYISLMGILLLEGFHLTSKIIAKRTYSYLMAVDICGTVQHLTQAVTLMSLSHYRGAASRLNKSWICECVLFLLLTNLGWWIEDSFYLEPELTRPGEVGTIEGMETYGTIVKPMVIFFRFHSATYFYNAWTIYRV